MRTWPRVLALALVLLAAGCTSNGPAVPAADLATPTRPAPAFAIVIPQDEARPAAWIEASAFRFHAGPNPYETYPGLPLPDGSTLLFDEIASFEVGEIANEQVQVRITRRDGRVLAGSLPRSGYVDGPTAQGYFRLDIDAVDRVDFQP